MSAWENFIAQVDSVALQAERPGSSWDQTTRLAHARRAANFWAAKRYRHGLAMTARAGELRRAREVSALRQRAAWLRARQGVGQR